MHISMDHYSRSNNKAIIFGITDSRLIQVNKPHKPISVKSASTKGTDAHLTPLPILWVRDV